MTEADQIKACAELDGKTSNAYWCPCGCGEQRNNNLPNYNSRDVLIPLIEKQPRHIQRSVAFELFWHNGSSVQEEAGEQTKTDVLTGLLASPSQLREALLRATGKWI